MPRMENCRSRLWHSWHSSVCGIRGIPGILRRLPVNARKRRRKLSPNDLKAEAFGGQVVHRLHLLLVKAVVTQQPVRSIQQRAKIPTVAIQCRQDEALRGAVAADG